MLAVSRMALAGAVGVHVRSCCRGGKLGSCAGEHVVAWFHTKDVLRSLSVDVSRLTCCGLCLARDELESCWSDEQCWGERAGRLVPRAGHAGCLCAERKLPGRTWACAEVGVWKLVLSRHVCWSLAMNR